MHPIGESNQVNHGAVQFHSRAMNCRWQDFQDCSFAGAGFQNSVAIAHVRHSDHAPGQVRWGFVELIQLLEVGDFAGNNRFVYTLGAIACKHVSRQAAVPL